MLIKPKNDAPSCPLDADLQRELATWLRPFDDPDDDGDGVKQRSGAPITIRISSEMLLDDMPADDDVE